MSWLWCFLVCGRILCTVQKISYNIYEILLCHTTTTKWCCSDMQQEHVASKLILSLFQHLQFSIYTRSLSLSFSFSSILTMLFSASHTISYFLYFTLWLAIRFIVRFNSVRCSFTATKPMPSIGLAGWWSETARKWWTIEWNQGLSELLPQCFLHLR